MGLLQRLAAIGLGNREEPAAMTPEPRQPQRQTPRPVDRAPPPARQPEPHVPEPIAEYARRPLPNRHIHQPLDQHGRPAPAPHGMDDDQLEIPAFLRRQAK